MRHVIVRARQVPIPLELRGGDYARDPKYRKAFQHWLQEIWHDKDATITGLLGATPTHMPAGPGPAVATESRSPR